MQDFSKSKVVGIAKDVGISISKSWPGMSEIWPLIEKMKNEGATIVLKLDGQRIPENGDNGQYTIIAQNGPLGDSMIRGNFEDVDEALCHLIVNYFSK